MLNSRSNTINVLKTRLFGAFPPIHPANGDHYRAVLERQFDKHVKVVRPEDVE
jgi:hypothetical protein